MCEKPHLTSLYQINGSPLFRIDASNLQISPHILDLAPIEVLIMTPLKCQLHTLIHLKPADPIEYSYFGYFEIGPSPTTRAKLAAWNLDNFFLSAVPWFAHEMFLCQSISLAFTANVS